MDSENVPQREDDQVIRKPMTLEEKLRLIEEMRGCTAGGPSMCDMLLEERRRERELELEKDGW
jgi:hypothetical protein